MNEDQLVAQAVEVAAHCGPRSLAQALVGELAADDLVETAFPNKMFRLGNVLFFLSSGDWVKAIDSALDAREAFLEVVYLPGATEYVAIAAAMAFPGANPKVGELRLYPTYGDSGAGLAQLGRRLREEADRMDPKFLGIVIHPEELVALLCHQYELPDQAASLPPVAPPPAAAVSSPKKAAGRKVRRRSN